jgi:hypothetical protein
MSTRSSWDGDGKSHARMPLASRTRTIARDGTPWGSAGASIGTGVRAELVVMRPRRSSTLARRASVRSCVPCVDLHRRRRGGHERHAAGGEAVDTMDARGFNGFGQRYRRQEGGEALGRPRRARPRGAQQQVMVTTPAWPSPWHQPRERSDGVRGRSDHS